MIVSIKSLNYFYCRIFGFYIDPTCYFDKFELKSISLRARFWWWVFMKIFKHIRCFTMKHCAQSKWSKLKFLNNICVDQSYIYTSSTSCLTAMHFSFMNQIIVRFYYKILLVQAKPDNFITYILYRELFTVFHNFTFNI